MKLRLPAFLLAAALAGCASPYRSGQTPDDVYYSPARPQPEYVYHETREDDHVRLHVAEDRYLRQRVRNRARWSEFDDYYHDPRAYVYSGWGYGFNPRLFWGHYYTPFTPWTPVLPSTAPVPRPQNQPRRFYFDNYQPAPVGNSRPSRTGPKDYPQSQGPGSNGSSRGSSMRDSFNGGGRSSSGSSSGGSGSSSSGSRNATPRRF